MEPLFIDIETIARPGAECLLPEVKAAGNLKDPDKIAKDKAEKQQKQIERMALDRRTCQVVTFAWAYGHDTIRASDIARYEGQECPERDLLEAFWYLMADTSGLPTPLHVGFNIYEFDLPILIRRSCLLGVKLTVRWEARKYQKYPVLDLMQEWVGWEGYCSLKDVCHECGITEPEGDGADVATMTPEQRIAHCKSDVEAARALYYKGKGWYW